MATETATKTATKEKPEVKVNTKLAALIKKYDASAEQTGLLYVELGEFITKENISNPVLIKTLMETRGINENSAKSQASRLRTVMKDTDSWEALKRGDVTVRAAVKGAQARRFGGSPLNKQKSFDSALQRFGEAAKALGQDKQTILATVAAKLDELKIK